MNLPGKEYSISARQQNTQTALVERFDPGQDALRDVQAAFTRPEGAQDANNLWQTMTQSANHVGRGIQILTENLILPDAKEALTIIARDGRLISHIKERRKIDPDDAFTCAYEVVDGLARGIRTEAALPNEAIALLPRVIFNSGMNQEEQLYLFLNAADCFNFGNPNPLPTVRDNRITGKPMEEARTLTLNVAKRLGKGEPSETGLRVTTAVYLSPRNWQIIHPTTQTTIDFKTLGAFYLAEVYDKFRNQENGHITAIDTIGEAIGDGTSVTKEFLGRLLAGTASFRRPVLDTQHMKPEQTFQPFLLEILSDLHANPQDKRLLHTLTNLIKGSMIHTGEVFDNVLLSHMQKSGIPEVLQFFYVDSYLEFLSSTLRFSIDDWPTEEECRGILNKTAIIYCEDFHTPGLPVILTQSNKTFITDGKVAVKPKPEDGQVIGYTKARKTKAQPPTDTSSPAREQQSAAFDFFETIPFIGKGNSAETSDLQPEIETDSSAPHFVEIVTLFDNNPAAPNSIPDPAHKHHDWHFFETIEPLFETKIQKVLTDAGIRPDLPNHVIEAFDISLAEIGRDLSKENLARTRTLAAKGNNVTFSENPIKSDENNFPRVHVKHDEPRSINGVLSSDIFGTLYLTPNLQVTFFLDKDCYPQGELDRLYNEGLVSWAQIWQIKYRLTATVHKLLIASQEELSQKHDALANHANREIGSGGGNRDHSAGRLAEKVRESEKYFDEAYTQWSMQPFDNKEGGKARERRFLSDELDEIDEAACEKAIAEMEKTGQETKTLWRQLNQAGMERARIEAHSKGHGVKKNPKGGYPMFMRSGRRQSVQAIDNAIENGIGLHKVIGITTNSAGLHDIVVSRSTFVSERIEPASQENAA